jgi:lipopolysaccharide export system protein LptC
MSSPIADDGALRGSGAHRDADIARRQAGIAKWRRRSREIKLYRVLLPGAIGIICLILGGLVLFNTVVWRFGRANTDAGVSIRMVNPKFYGRDSSNAPYVVTAKSALRDEGDFQRVELERPHVTLARGTATESSLEAAKGVYREDTKILTLDKDLVVIDKRGYRFKAQHAIVDTRTGAIQGESPIDGDGPLGRISATSYAVSPGGAHVFFRGNVRTRIERSAAHK